MASTQTRREDYERAKAECARLTEALRTFDADDVTSETRLKAQLAAEILRIQALKEQLR